MYHVTLTAEERFFHNSTYTNGLAVAHAYLKTREIDMHNLRTDLTFKFPFYTCDILRCTIYGHTIVMNRSDGMCELYTSQGKRHDADPLRGRIEQVLAYILAVNW
jgi:hypothetical protein